jgi:hypothetical protein
MKYLVFGLAVSTTICAAALVLANPGLLPKHEGYPMGKATDPVSGRSLSNDPGQENATGEKALHQSARSEDMHVTQNFSREQDGRVLEKPGAGILPKVEGPQIKIEPPVKEATKTPANPQ